MRRLALLLVLGPVLSATARAHPHSIPSVWVDLTVAGGAITARITLQVEVLNPWLGRDRIDSAWMGRHRWKKSAPAVAALIADVFPIAVEGRALAPRVEMIAIDDALLQDDGTEYGRIDVRWPLAGPLPRVQFLWSRFDLVDDGTGSRAVRYTLAHGDLIDDGSMSRDEPGFTWHRPRDRATAVPLARAIAAGRSPTPWLALGLAIAGAVALIQLGPRPPLALPVASLLFAAAVYAPRPAPRLRTPSPVQARRIFETLHDNIYRAFGANTEDDIYRLLRASVDAGILDRMYGDVYESLLMREEGGAFSRIQELKRTDGDVLIARDELSFRAEWSWRVHLVVTHWGHAHRRVDAYRAAYDVVHDGESWKIAGVDLKERKRISKE